MHSRFHRLAARLRSAPSVGFLSFLFLAQPRTAHADDWPCFRGPRVDGISTEKLPSGPDGIALEVAWKKPLGSGYSGVSIVGDRVVTMFSDGKSDHVIALNASDGSELWRHELGPTYEGHDGSHTGPIATPVIKDGHVFALAPSGTLLSLDLSSGKPDWSIDISKKYEAGLPFYGFGGSPIIIGNTLIVGPGSKDGVLAGFDSKTGERLWTAGDDRWQYQTPVPSTLGGKSGVLAAGTSKLALINPESGEIHWQSAHGGDGAIGAGSITRSVRTGSSCGTRRTHPRCSGSLHRARATRSNRCGTSGPFGTVTMFPSIAIGTYTATQAGFSLALMPRPAASDGARASRVTASQSSSAITSSF
jgi:hypothetical protein